VDAPPRKALVDRIALDPPERRAIAEVHAVEADSQRRALDHRAAVERDRVREPAPGDVEP
jgi:hypothetical protein